MAESMIISDTAILSILFAVSESSFLYVNYLARVKYKGQFREMTGIWRHLDKKIPTALSVILGICLTSSLFAITLILDDLTMFSAIITGIVASNAMIDYVVVERSIVCIKLDCKQEQRSICRKCDIPEQYNVNMITQNIKKRKITQKKKAIKKPRDNHG